MNKTKPIYTPAYNIESFLPDSRPMLYDYCCSLCGGVLEDPVLDSCGSIYCKKCVMNYVNDKGLCPNNKKCDPSKFIHMKFIAQIIEKQILYCKNKTLGCDWSDVYVKLASHLIDDCKFQPIKCCNEGCEVELCKTSMESHLINCEYKKVKCLNCETTIKIKENEEHIEVCPKVWINCPKNCGESMDRIDLNIHFTICKNVAVECTYKNIGCFFNSPRSELNEHMKTSADNHNLLIINEFHQFNKKFTQFSEYIEKKIETLNKKYDSSQSKLVLQSGQDSKVNKSNILTDKTTSKSNSILENKIYNEVNSKKEDESSKSKTFNIVKSKEFMNKKRIRGVNLTDDENENEIQVIGFNPSKKYKNSSDDYQPKYNSSISPSFRSKMNNHQMDKYNENTKYNLEKRHSLYEEITIDTIDISKGIYVNVNVAFSMSVPNLKQEHRFAMVNNILNDSNCEWKVTINKLASKWIGIGVCLKELVVSNKFKFIGSKNNFMHGTFMISLNGYSWNTNKEEEDNKIIANFPSVKSGDEIGFKFEYEKEILEIRIGSFKFVLNDVAYPKGNYLVPCVVFLAPGDEIEFSNLSKF